LGGGRWGSIVRGTTLPLLNSYERGNLDNKFYEISEDEANQIVERIRATVSGQG
jgi:hypothetical protein